MTAFAYPVSLDLRGKLAVVVGELAVRERKPDGLRAAGASVLVVGPRGRGKVRELLLGSTAKASIESSHCDVLVVKSRD